MKLKIDGMSCSGCKALITDILDDLNCEIKSFEGGNIEIETDKNFDEIKKAIEAEEEFKVSLQ